MGKRTAVAVHRCRFVDFDPSAISALAFPPLPLPKRTAAPQPLTFGPLAVGHTNGNIDLCQWTGSGERSSSPQAWVVRKTLVGSFPSKVDSLAFAIRSPDNLDCNDVPSVSDLRLFSSGGGSDLVEWDMGRGCIRRTISSQGGSIWSIAVNPTSSLLALGCEDGSIRLLSLLLDSLTHHRRFDRIKCRLLSIAWGPPLLRRAPDNRHDSDDSDEDDNDVWHDSWLVTGGSDSSLTKWDVSTGRPLSRMKTDKMRGERTLVWAVGVLGDGTVVSGDSLGMVKFWDSQTCTQLQSFQGHSADVLCLSIGPGGTTVYTSGIDQKISQFSLVNMPSSNRWVQSISRRMHSHDVRALHTWPPYTTLPPLYQRQFPIDIAPVLASGGLDMSVVLTPVGLPDHTVVKVTNPLCTSTDSTFELSHHRRLAYTCGPSSTIAVRVARKARLVSCMRETSLSFWKINPKQPSSIENIVENCSQELADGGGWEKVLDMEFNVHTNLIASAISVNGVHLVVSDLYETKLFVMKNNDQDVLTPHRIRDFSSIIWQHMTRSAASTGGSAFAFTPDSSKLVMATAMSAHILIIDLRSGEQTPSVLRRFDHHRQCSIIGDRAVTGRVIDEDAKLSIESEINSEDSVEVKVLRLAISTDGQWLASSDDHSRTHVFNLDSLQHHCTLPSFPHPVQTLAFDPSHQNVLIMAFPNNTLQIFDVESRQFPAWSKRLSDSLPFTDAHDPILGVTFDPAASNASTVTPEYSHAVFWGSTWICQVNLDGSSANTSAKKRRRENKTSSVTTPMGPSYTTPTEKVDVSLGDPSQDCKMITHFRPILCVDFLSDGEMVVVERPLVDILINLPPAYFRQKYGAS